MFKTNEELEEQLNYSYDNLTYKEAYEKGLELYEKAKDLSAKAQIALKEAEIAYKSLELCTLRNQATIIQYDIEKRKEFSNV